MLKKTATNAPVRKVSLGAVAGAASIVLVWVLNTYVLPDDGQIPEAVASAITTVLTFLVSYFVRPAPEDQVVDDPG